MITFAQIKNNANTAATNAVTSFKSIPAALSRTVAKIFTAISNAFAFVKTSLSSAIHSISRTKIQPTAKAPVETLAPVVTPVPVETSVAATEPAKRGYLTRAFSATASVVTKGGERCFNAFGATETGSKITTTATVVGGLALFTAATASLVK